MQDKKTIIAAFAGDLVFEAKTIKIIEKEGCNILAQRIWQPFRNADFGLVNLEAPITDRSITRENKRYNLRIPSKALPLLEKKIVFSLANNHIMDYGYEGLEDTINHFIKNGIRFAGAGFNLEEARKPFIFQTGHFSIAVVCATDPRYQPAGASIPGTNPADPEMLKDTLRNVRDQVDIVIVSLHIGMEFVPAPTPFMKSLGELCIEEGASVVQFHHAHCLSGWSLYNQRVILWGTGNYAFPRVIPKGYKPWSESAVWQLRLNHTGEIVGETEIIPIQISDEGIPSPIEGIKAKKIIETIKKNSRKIAKDQNHIFWRLSSILQPGYLRISLSNYYDIAKRGGIKVLIDSVMSSMSILFKRIKK